MFRIFHELSLRLAPYIFVTSYLWVVEPTCLICVFHIHSESDIDIYYSIFQSLPYGELKISLANKFGFEIPPQSFSVHPNYPNPFNPITTIKYEIPIKGNITIQISNLYGQQVVEYKEIGVKSGYYSYTWDASDYSSGIYFFSIFFNNALINSQKIILIK